MASQVEEYIEKQKLPQREILQQVRKIFRETLPNCKEEMRWGVITFASGKFYIAAMRDRVHVGFAITGLRSDELALFEGNGKTMRHIKIPTIDAVDKSKLVRLIEIVNQKAICDSC
jgi:uncharacterized protein YdhG (YjbR/CyaY superfamily)